MDGPPVEQPSAEPADALRVRFEATVHRGKGELALESVADLDLDRVPDPEGAVRLLLTPEDAARLVSRGYEVHLVGVLPVTPLDASLVTDEGSALRWLEEQVKGIQRNQAS